MSIDVCAQTLHRYLLAEDVFETIDVFEQQATFGGCWNYTNDPKGSVDVPQTDPNKPLDRPIWRPAKSPNGYANGEKRAVFESPMYERLETNIPHVIMKHSADPSLEDDQLFPSRERVTQYLEAYAREIKRLVHFETQVIDIRKTSLDGQDVWHVHVKDLLSDRVFDATYDAVVVANGHYSVPDLPDIQGIKAWNQANPGVIAHSKFYRRPDSYTDKKVIIIGNSASGVDIASQIATVARHPVLISIRSSSPLAYEAGYKEDVAQIAEFLPSSQGTRAVRFTDGRVEEDVDAILFATGYFYSFPFLSQLQPKLILTGDRVEHLYKHLFYIYDPTLAFIGLPSKIIPFRTFEGQAAVIARVWSDRLELPPVQEMKKWEEGVIAKQGSGKAFHELKFPEDFDYLNEMVEWSKQAKEPGRGKIPPRWSERETWTRKRFPAIKKAFNDQGEARHKVRTVEELGFDYDAWLREQKIWVDGKT